MVFMTSFTASNSKIAAFQQKIQTPSVCAMLILAVISSIAWIVWRPGYSEAVLFFPGAVRTGISGESRAVPRISDREARAAMLIDEIVLGPLSVEGGRVFPRDTVVRSLMLRSGVLYVNFDSQQLMSEIDTNLTYSEAEDALLRSLQFNLPFIKEKVITIDGQIPFEIPFAIE